jgi:hypothetical protein
MGKRGGKGRGRPQITGTDQYGEDYVDRNDGNHGFGGPSGRSGGAAESKSVTCAFLVSLRNYLHICPRYMRICIYGKSWSQLFAVAGTSGYIDMLV